MRKQFLRVFTLVLVTLLLFVSCSGSLTDSLLKIMDGTNTNVYIKAGIVKPNTAVASKVLDALKTSNTTVTITDNKVSINVGGADVKIEVDDDLKAVIEEKGILKPQTAEQKKQLTESINEALSSPTNKDQLANEFSKAVTDKATQNAIKGTYALGSISVKTAATTITYTCVQQVLNDLADNYKAVAKDDKATLTEADKAQAQLMTNVAASAAKASSVLSSSKSAEEKMKDPAVKEFLNDTVTLYNAAKIATGSVDILTTEGLFDSLMSSKGSRAIDVDVSGIPSNLKKLIPNLVEKLLGKDPSKYDSKIRSYTAMVNAKKAAFAIVGKDGKAPALKSQASIGSIIEYITAAAVKQIGNNGVSYEEIDLLKIVVDVVNTSGDGFFNDMKDVKTTLAIEKLFKDDTSEEEMKKLMNSLLNSIYKDALIADTMLTVGESSFDDLLKQFGQDNTEKITTISGFIKKLITDMGGTVNESN